MSEEVSLNLASMPAPVLDVVMKSVDLKTVQAVRKVCSNLRDHIDGIQLDGKIRKIYIYAASSEKISIELKTLDDLFEITYQQIGTDCTIDHGGTNIVKNQDIGTCVGNDMGLVLKNQKSIVKEISLVLAEKCGEAVLENLLITLGTHLQSRKSKLQLKYFSWTGAINQDHILKILEHLDPVTMNKIDLTNGRDIGVQPPKVYSIDRIVNSQQWQKARQVETLGFVAQTALSNFSKFWKAHFSIDTIDLQTLLAIRQNALRTPKFLEFSCVYNKFNDETQFLSQLGQPYKTFKKQKYWYYKFPMNDSAMLVTWKAKCIRFSRIEPKNFEKYGVPSNDLKEL